ncbi:hypothetical protein WH95_09130 [Kiloniella litopenaei]|uniref:Uncharacterized protein n=1 Tax=Kiloniella litopenaei TaxID=1549748 RepID=A0A0M2RC96_9PROT|nr:hypothetical protein [Kiloniella litopenaei]KKJ77203.1 hypothetical protein WH95_09130 [Kiloniella litopenaei]
MNSKKDKISPNIRTMVKWIAVGDVLFGIAVMLTAHYILQNEIVQWFGLAVTLLGGLLFLTMRLLEKRQTRIINPKDDSLD